jgi:hypothetical protein
LNSMTNATINTPKSMTTNIKSVNKSLESNHYMRDKRPLVEQRDQLMTSENRQTSYTRPFVFPSRSTPLLKPKLSNASQDCSHNNKLTEYVMNLLNSSKHNISIDGRNVWNASNNDMISQLIPRDDRKVMPSIVRSDEFGPKKRVNENSRNKKDLNNDNNDYTIEGNDSNESVVTESISTLGLIDDQSVAGLIALQAINYKLTLLVRLYLTNCENVFIYNCINYSQLTY